MPALTILFPGDAPFRVDPLVRRRGNIAMNDTQLAMLRQIVDQNGEQVAQQADVVLDIAERGTFEPDHEKTIATQCMKLLIAILKIQREDTKRSSVC